MGERESILDILEAYGIGEKYEGQLSDIARDIHWMFLGIKPDIRRLGSEDMIEKAKELEQRIQRKVNSILPNALKLWI